MNNFQIFSGGTDTHLMLVDLRPYGITGKDAEAISKETTYESGEGDAVIIPLPSGSGQSPMMTGRKNKRGSGAKTRVVVLDDTELALYGGK